MGVFSWKTGDTGRSISSTGNCGNYPIFPVVMVDPDGNRWVENEYEGYGVFGGKDIYELIAELNGVDPNLSTDEKRDFGIGLTCGSSASGDFREASLAGVKVPKLFENLNANYSDYAFPEICEFQGYFYYDEEDDYDDDGGQYC